MAVGFGDKISFHPKATPGDWNGAGLHSNLSSLDMGEPGRMKHIKAAFKKPEACHQEHITVCSKEPYV
jgi:glutamine synthetase